MVDRYQAAHGCQRSVRLGLVLPQGSTGELGGHRPDELLTVVERFARSADKAGFDSLWVSDHFLPTRPLDRGGLLDSWTLLSVVSQLTSRVRLGQLVLCSAFRNPALVAKMAATLDILSGGRMILGLGAGWHRKEFEAYGYPFLAAPERLAQLRETVKVVRLLWAGEGIVHEGRHFRITDAPFEPVPLQGQPPILIGGMGKVILKLASEVADMTNFFGTPEAFREASGLLDRRCEHVGRDPASIERTWMTIGLHVGESEAEVRRTLEGWREAGDVRYVRCQISGTPEQVVSQLAPYVQAGCGTLILTLSTSPATDGIDLLAEAVAPALQSVCI